MRTGTAHSRKFISSLFIVPEFINVSFGIGPDCHFLTLPV